MNRSELQSTCQADTVFQRTLLMRLPTDLFFCYQFCRVDLTSNSNSISGIVLRCHKRITSFLFVPWRLDQSLFFMLVAMLPRRLWHPGSDALCARKLFLAITKEFMAKQTTKSMRNSTHLATLWMVTRIGRAGTGGTRTRTARTSGIPGICWIHLVQRDGPNMNGRSKVIPGHMLVGQFINASTAMQFAHAMVRSMEERGLGHREEPVTFSKIKRRARFKKLTILGDALFHVVEPNSGQRSDKLFVLVNDKCMETLLCGKVSRQRGAINDVAKLFWFHTFLYIFIFEMTPKNKEPHTKHYLWSFSTGHQSKSYCGWRGHYFVAKGFRLRDFIKASSIHWWSDRILP